MSTLVRHVMTKDPKTLSSSMTPADAAGIMAKYDVGAVPISDDDGRLLGLVTDRDLVTRVLAERQDPFQVPLDSIATQTVVTVSPDTELADARDLMAEHRVRRLPVVKGDRLVGILSLGDVALGLASARAVGQALQEVSEGANRPDLHEGPDIGTPDRVRRG